MPKSALPPWIKDQAEGTGTDWDNPIQKHFHKSWFAFGPRATEWWAKWREWPKTLFAIRSEQGIFRVETELWARDSGQESIITASRIVNRTLIADYTVVDVSVYLSRIQYYCRWHVQIQWPLMIAAHRYNSPIDVPKYGEPRPDTDGKLWFFYIGAHRDPDKVYWWPSAYLGRNWK